MKLLSPVAGGLEKQNTIPEQLASYRMPSAAYSVYHTPSGNSILIQEITHDKGLTRIVDAVCVAPETIIIQEDTPLIEMLFSLQDSIYLGVNNSLRLILHERGLNVLYNNTLFKELTLRATTTVRFVSIQWPPNFFHQYLTALHNHAPFFSKMQSNAPALLTKGYAIVNSGALSNTLLLRKLTDSNKINVALTAVKLICLQLLNDNTHKPLKLKQDTIDKVYAFKNYLVTHLNKHLPIQETAQQFLNARNLQNYFPEIYGCTVRKFLHEQRMLVAVDLLSNPDNKLEYIALKLGYAHTSTFVDAFSSYYNISPTDFRKKYFQIM